MNEVSSLLAQMDQVLVGAKGVRSSAAALDPSAKKKSKEQNADMFGDILAEVEGKMLDMQRYSVSRGGSRRKIV